jgi:NTE family protein
MTLGRTHPPVSFALVLSGGGARGLAHAGVLRALEHYGFFPQAIVGVSMGAIVAATYALNPDWYHALQTMDTRGFPEPPAPRSKHFRERLRSLRAYERAISTMLTGWGVGAKAQPYGLKLLRQLTLERNLETGRIPILTVATDLASGQRFVFSQGSAAQAAYASAALAGILPPLSLEGKLLADGTYADIAPVDLARAFKVRHVIAVDPRSVDTPYHVTNGLKALMRALEICHQQHAQARFAQADLTLVPRFPFAIDTLDFSQKRLCVAVGIRAVRAALPQLRSLLEA